MFGGGGAATLSLLMRVLQSCMLVHVWQFERYISVIKLNTSNTELFRFQFRWVDMQRSTRDEHVSMHAEIFNTSRLNDSIIRLTSIERYRMPI